MARKRKVPVNELETRLFSGLLTKIEDILHEHNYPIEIIARLLKVQGRETLAKMLKLAHADWQKEQALLAEAEAATAACLKQQTLEPPWQAPSTAMVTYIQPEFDELCSKFEKVILYYRLSKFEAVDRCRNVSRINREVAFELVHLGRQAKNADVLGEMDKRHLRPALYEELLGFATKCLADKRKKHIIVALGSCTRTNFKPLFAVLVLSDEIVLGMQSDEEYVWDHNYEFLGVRE